MTQTSDSPYAARPWLRHYDYWVRPHMNYPGRPLYEVLASTAIDLPDAPATSFLGATLSFGELKRRADRFAASLHALGVSKGDRIGIMLPNCPQYVIATFGILRLGAVLVNVNPIYTAREVLDVVRDSGMRLLVTLDVLAPLAQSICADTTLRDIVITSLGEYSSAAAAPAHVDGTRSMADMLTGDHAGLPVVPLSSDDLAVLQYTGGTTGAPKGAMLTHGNIFANLVQTEACMYRNLERGEARYLLVIPYFHIYGFTVGMMKGLWVGALQILLPKYDPDQVLAALRDFSPTYFPAVPTVFVSLLNHAGRDAHGLEKIRTYNSGGAPCPVEVLEQWERVVGRPLNEGYGLSETSPVTHTTGALSLRKIGSIGLPVPDTDMKIVDVETGLREVPIGEAGELCIAGPQVFTGYWNRPEETAYALRTHLDGRTWFHTGDIARMDEDGYSYIVQRKKDMIIVDGFNVYPSEVEGVLYGHPAVRLAAVIGIPHAYHGEVVKACLVLKPGATATREEIVAYCKRDLAAYKVPREVEFRDTVPMSAVGKILYRVLRDEHATRTASQAS